MHILNCKMTVILGIFLSYFIKLSAGRVLKSYLYVTNCSISVLVTSNVTRIENYLYANG